ncbi:MAG: DUF4384 domain-containing protein [Spirochaetota bacterium]|nr:DUF4384 domain-containing protein [Spirochaetota bacterium]
MRRLSYYIITTLFIISFSSQCLVVSPENTEQDDIKTSWDEVTSSDNPDFVNSSKRWDEEVKISKEEKDTARTFLQFIIHQEGSKETLGNRGHVYSGEAFQLIVRASKPSYFYIFQVDGSKTIYPYFISEDAVYNFVGPMDNFGKTSGREMFYIFVSRKPMRTLNKIYNRLDPDGQRFRMRSRIAKALNRIYRKGKQNILSKKNKIYRFNHYFSKKLVFRHKNMPL